MTHRQRTVPHRAAALGVGVLALTLPTSALANPRPLPFTYTAQTSAAGEAEIEQYADLVPVKALRTLDGKPVTLLGTQFQTEFEYGITDKLELGLYVTYAPKPGESYTLVPNLLWGNGLKQRLRYRFADEGEWPVDVAVYGEIAEMADELEVEAKLILAKRFGHLRLVTNLWAEHEIYLAKSEREWILNPTLGATVQVTPSFHVGAEGFMRLELGDDDVKGPRPFELGPHVYAGPTFLFSFGSLWWSTGLYARATDFNRVPQAGEGFGPFWARTIVGVSL